MSGHLQVAVTSNLSSTEVTCAFLPSTDNYGVAQLYRRIISPSVKVHNEEWQKQTHYRHTNYKNQSPVSRLKMASPVHSVASAPGHLEANDLSLQVLQPWFKTSIGRLTLRSQ